MKRILFFDDNPHRHRKISQHLVCDGAYTVAEAVSKFQQHKYDIVFLDHDLGGDEHVDSHGEEETGYTLVKWIAANRPKIGLVVIHTLNHPGGTLMFTELINSDYLVARIPFTTIDEAVVRQILTMDLEEL